MELADPENLTLQVFNTTAEVGGARVTLGFDRHTLILLLLSLQAGCECLCGEEF